MMPSRPGFERHTMKMYILVKESVPMGCAIVAVAHASLAAYLKYQNSPEVKQWLAGPFNKVDCKVDGVDFERAKLEPNNVVITESALNQEEVAIAFMPRENWPKSFQYFPMYRES